MPIVTIFYQTRINNHKYMEILNKDNYEAPSILVVEVKSEGMICVSTDGYGWYDEDE